MLRRLIYGCIVLGALGLAVFLFLTSPSTIAATDIPTAAGDAKKLGDPSFIVDVTDSTEAEASSFTLAADREVMD